MTRTRRRPYVNPFVHIPEWTGWRIAQVIIFAPLGAVRFALMLLILVLCRVLATFLSRLMDIIQCRPELRRTFRKVIQYPVTILLRAAFFVAGFLWIPRQDTEYNPVKLSEIKGPIIVMGPHTSMFDVIGQLMLGTPPILVKAELAANWIIGPILKMSDPIMVQRDDRGNRVRVKEMIAERAHYDKILLFPEGTCTNHSSLLVFKEGAFKPGFPVQPVLLEYEDYGWDTFTWTFHAPSGAWQSFLCMCRPYLKLRLRVLPQYAPSEEERGDSRLYADNVRRLMASHLKVPLSHYVYEDTRFMDFALSNKIPMSAVCLKLIKLCRRIASIGRAHSINAITTDHLRTFLDAMNVHIRGEPRRRIENRSSLLKALIGRDTITPTAVRRGSTRECLDALQAPFGWSNPRGKLMAGHILVIHHLADLRVERPGERIRNAFNELATLPYPKASDPSRSGSKSQKSKANGHRSKELARRQSRPVTVTRGPEKKKKKSTDDDGTGETHQELVLTRENLSVFLWFLLNMNISEPQYRRPEGDSDPSDTSNLDILPGGTDPLTWSQVRALLLGPLSWEVRQNAPFLLEADAL